MLKDLHNNSRAIAAISAQAMTTVAGVTGNVIDRQGFGGVEFVFNYGAITATGATINVAIMEGDTTGSLTSVADADLLGTEALASIPAATRVDGSTEKVAKRVGYVGNKRYVRADIASSTVTAATVVSAEAILHAPDVAPTSNP